MKKIAYSVLTLVLLATCRPDRPQSNIIKVKFTDEKGTQVKERASGQVLIISSSQFANLSPNGLNPNNAQLMIDNVLVPFQQITPTSISLIMPVKFLHDYKELVFTIRYNQILYEMFQRIFYRPRVTGEVLAGNDGTFQMPAEMTIDAAGNLYVIDQRAMHDVIIRVTPDGTSSLLAGGAGEFGRLVGIGINNTTNDIFISDATAQQVRGFNLASPSTIFTLAGSGTAGNTDGTGLSATFRFSNKRVDDFSTNETGQGLFVDPMGNVFVGEQFGTASSGLESQIRKITPAGVVTTVPGSRITMPTGPESLLPVAGLTQNTTTSELAYIGGASSFLQAIATIAPDGTVTRIAGQVSNEDLVDGTGTAVEFAYPKAISYNTGYFHVADGSNGAYRRATTSGTVITLAGVGHFDTPGFCLCGITGPRDSSYLFPSIFDSSPDRYQLVAKAIIMDQVGGIAVRNNALVYLTDYGSDFKCIWRIRIE